MSLILNGTLYRNSQEAVVSVYDHGFLYGIGLFETFRTYAGEPFLLGEHLRRLEQGCDQLGIHVTLNEPDVRAQISTLLEADELQDGYFRLSVSAGEAALGLPTGDYSEPNVLLYMKELPKRDPVLYAQGKALQKLKLPRNTPEGPVRLKSFHYMNSILAKREMAQYPWAAGAEGLFLTADGILAEGIVSNLFWLRDGVCRTPSIDTGILPGITRAYALRLCDSALGIPVEEGRWSWEELTLADEAFVTNSIQEIVPVTKLYDEKGACLPVGNGSVGPVTSRMMAVYRGKAD